MKLFVMGSILIGLLGCGSIEKSPENVDRNEPASGTDSQVKKENRRHGFSENREFRGGSGRF